MPIRLFLDGQAFDPETIARMSAALEGVCEALSMKLVDDAATRLVAQKIIELTQRGVKDVGMLRAMTLNNLTLPRAASTSCGALNVCAGTACAYFG